MTVPEWYDETPTTALFKTKSIGLMLNQNKFLPSVLHKYFIAGFVFCASLLALGLAGMARCAWQPGINCGIDLVTIDSTVIETTIKPEGPPVTQSHGWVNENEFAVFSPPSIGGKLENARLDVYNIINREWKSVDIAPILCRGSYGRIEFRRIIRLQNGNGAIQVKCLGYGEGTTIYEILPDKDSFQFRPIFSAEGIQPFHSDIEISKADSALYAVHAYAPQSLLVQPLHHSRFNPKVIFPELKVGRNSEISLANDSSKLAVSSFRFRLQWLNKSVYTIYNVDVATEEVEPIFGNVRQLRNLQWSADGTSLLFTGEVKGHEGIWQLDLAQKKLRFIHPLDYSSFDVYWSPDNRYILFQTNHDGDNRTPPRFEIIDLENR